MNKNKPKFSELLHGAFYDVLKRAGLSMNIDQHEKVRKSAENMGDVISEHAEATARKFILKLQKALKNAFKEMAEDVELLEKRAANLEKRMRDLDLLENRIKDLEKRTPNVNRSNKSA